MKLIKCTVIGESAIKAACEEEISRLIASTLQIELEQKSNNDKGKEKND